MHSQSDELTVVRLVWNWLHKFTKPNCYLFFYIKFRNKTIYRMSSTRGSQAPYGLHGARGHTVRNHRLNDTSNYQKRLKALLVWRVKLTSLFWGSQKNHISRNSLILQNKTLHNRQRHMGFPYGLCLKNTFRDINILVMLNLAIMWAYTYVIDSSSVTLVLF